MAFIRIGSTAEPHLGAELVDTPTCPATVPTSWILKVRSFAVVLADPVPAQAPEAVSAANRICHDSVTALSRHGGNLLVMKKSKAVTLSVVASVAAIAMTGCGGRAQVRRCVDQNGQLLPDIQCGTTSTRTAYRFGSSYPHWVYGGTISKGRITGYSNSPSSTSDIVDSRGTVVRRGFGGGSSSSHSSFGG